LRISFPMWGPVVNPLMYCTRSIFVIEKTHTQKKIPKESHTCPCWSNQQA
jgi:hypothetical protein